MSTNVIIFDADYISELTSRMQTACSLMDEAVSSLKKASMHEGWKCKENVRISAEIDELNTRLGRLNEGINETVRVLGGSVSSFADLEAKYESQANNLSDDLIVNNGFTATNYTDINTSGEAAVTEAGNTTAGENISGTAGPAAVNGVSIGGAAMRIMTPGVNSNVNNNNLVQSINIPVTYIPDKPESAAKGIKYTQRISDITVDSVADSITQVLAASDNSDLRALRAQNLVDTYNAGKIVADNSEQIISSPAMPHTEERLAMASGLVNLAGCGMFTSSSGSSVINSASISNNAQELLPAVKNISGSEEISSVLEKISGGSSSSDGDSFFERIIKSLFGKINGESSESVSASSTSNSPVQEFFNSFVADWEA